MYSEEEQEINSEILMAEIIEREREYFDNCRYCTCDADRVRDCTCDPEKRKRFKRRVGRKVSKEFLPRILELSPGAQSLLRDAKLAKEAEEFKDNGEDE